MAKKANSINKANEQIVIRIDFEQVERALKSKSTTIEKIEYLDWLIDYNGVAKGVKYFSDHANHSEPLNSFWDGIMYQRAGMADEKSDNAYYLQGIQAWKDYCRVLQMKVGLEQGKPISFDGSNEIQPAKIKIEVTDQKRFNAVLSYFKRMGIEEKVLIDAIEGNSNHAKINWPKNQTQLADLFRRLLANEVIHGTYTSIANWIHTYFEVEVKGRKQPANFTSIKDVLSEKKKQGRTYRTPISNRLLLDDFPEVTKQE
jgi:hypothetical protein